MEIEEPGTVTDRAATAKRVCLLTGAGGNLGTAFCRLVSEKYHIVAVYRMWEPQVPSQQQRLIDPLLPHERLPENAHPVFAIQADLAYDHDLKRIAELTLARFDRVDVLVNAAAYSVWAPIIDGERLIASAERQFRINTIVPVKLAAILAHEYWQHRATENIAMNRNIVNISSIAGLRVYPSLGQSVYAASKAALNHLTRHMATEFQAFGVRVNAVAPNSFPRIVTVEQVVASIVSLDEGSVTGQTVLLDRDSKDLQ